MCWCRPNVRTPNCGSVECVAIAARMATAKTKDSMAQVYRADMRRIAEALGLADSVADIGHILGAIDELAAERDKYEACAMRNRGRIEGEAVKRIVAWLRADAKRCRDRGESWKVPSTDAAVAAHTEIYADAIERGDWRNGGGRDG